MQRIVSTLNHRYFVWSILALPMIGLSIGYVQGAVFYGEVLHVSGELSVRLLMLTLAVTPLRMMFRKARWSQWFVQRRRWFGVASFAYAFFHTLIYLGKKSDLSLVLGEGRLFEMWTGWLSLAILLMLALSSNNRSVRLLKQTWKRLHRLVYVAALLAFAHWIFIAFDPLPAVVHLLVLLSLESSRLYMTHRASQNQVTELRD